MLLPLFDFLKKKNVGLNIHFNYNLKSKDTSQSNSNYPISLAQKQLCSFILAQFALF